jgi:DNA-binding XRE family transcriptional regulator
LRIFNIHKIENSKFSEKSYPVTMNIDEKEKLARTGDVSPDAIRDRLLAARKSIKMQQKDVAGEVGLKVTTFNSQETRGAPSIKTMRYYHRQHRIDFNFILHGDFAQLPLDVQDRLFSALSEK